MNSPKRSIEEIIEIKDCTQAWIQDLEHGVLQKTGLGIPLMKITWTADTSVLVEKLLHQQVKNKKNLIGDSIVNFCFRP